MELLPGVSVVPVVDRSTLTVAGVVVFLVLMALSAFFSSSEIAMFSLAKHRIDALVDEGVANAERVQALRNEPHRMLVTILVGNNLSNIAMSSIATGILAFYVTPSEAVVIATFGVTSVVLLFSESAPKSYAVVNPESWALRVARPIQLTETLLYPIVVVFDYLTRLINRVTGGQSTIETAYITRTELQELVEAGEKQGVLEETEGEIIQQTLRFTTTIAREVMVPRADVAAIPTTATVEEAIDTCVASGHPRLPVYDDDFQSVLGSVHVLDLVRDRQTTTDGADLLDLVHPTLLVPDSKPVDDILAAMQRNRLDMVIVIDEFGSIGGLVTIEDIIEELVGEILGPTDVAPVEMVDETTALVQGDASIEAVNDALGIDLPTQDTYETIAGFLLSQAGRIPDEDETIAAFGVTLTPLRVDNGRILRIRVELPGSNETP